MKNILIPTDYTQISIEEAALAVRQLESRFNIIFFHAFDMPASLMEVMVRGQAMQQHVLITENIRQRCKRIKQQNKQIGQIYFRPMYGSTLSVFRSYILANAIDMVLLPPNYRFVPVLQESVNPQPLFSKQVVPVVTATFISATHSINDGGTMHAPTIPVLAV